MSNPPQVFVTWICCTYKRPDLLRNLLYCFCHQNYPAEFLRLVVLDDAGQYHKADTGLSELVTMVSVDRRFRSLPEKHNAAAALIDPKTEVIIVADDDDIYLPNHTLSHVTALRGHASATLSKPSRILTDCGQSGSIKREESGMRFHGSIAFRLVDYLELGGWPLTDHPAFDLRMIEIMAAGGVADPSRRGFAETYCYRWNSGAFHCGTMQRNPNDLEWYKRGAEHDSAPRVVMSPKPDNFTLRLISEYAD